MEKGRVGIVVVGVVSHERICQVRGNQTKADADRSEPRTVTESRASQGGSPQIYLDAKLPHWILCFPLCTDHGSS